jgi:hypothetical protein
MCLMKTLNECELGLIGIGFEDFEQQAERFQRPAADPSVNLVGFSDGSLSGDDSSSVLAWLQQLDSCGDAMWWGMGRCRKKVACLLAEAVLHWRLAGNTNS